MLGRKNSCAGQDNSADRVTEEATPATDAGIGGRDFPSDFVVERTVKVESSLRVSATIEPQHFDRLILIDKHPPHHLPTNMPLACVSCFRRFFLHGFAALRRTDATKSAPRGGSY